MDVMPVAEARAGLSRMLADFRRDGDLEVVIGSHRRPEAVVMPFARYRRLADQPKRPTVGLRRLRELRPVIVRLAEASGLSDVRVFGSVARGDENSGSDVDLLVTPRDGATLFDVAQFELDLELILEVPVSVVSLCALDAERDARMLHDAVPL
ncbi:nucleotidyltransferase domain-containing protein [Microbacterium sp. NPDC089987]|uniref:nucleotidyltransferase domain-containing protein n=1 Tax=Microbacterium sp. NPDC089987 TaxID=3364202 RepID=UPI0037F3A65B